MFKKISASLIFALFMFPFLTVAASFKTGSSFFLKEDEVISENLYVLSGNVNILGEVQGDLAVVAGNLMIGASVKEDIIAAGGSVNINSNVSGDVRIVGGNLNLSGNIGGDFIGVGGQIMLLEGTQIGKDVALLGGNIHIAANINGLVKLSGQEVFFDGFAGNNLIIRASKIKVGPNARIKGDLDYYSTEEAEISPSVIVSGKINFHKLEPKNVKQEGFRLRFVGVLSTFWLIKTLIVITGALVFYLAFRAGVKLLVDSTVNNFGQNLLKGFVAFVVIPVASVILIATLIGIIPAIVLILVYVLIMIISKVFSGMLFIGAVSKIFFKKRDFELTWPVVILGVIVFELVVSIPFVGWFIGLVFSLSSFGALANSFYKKFYRSDGGLGI